MAADVAKRAKAMRLAQNLSQRSMAERSGVSQASLKRFEHTGEIAFASLLKVAVVLGCMDDFGALFAPRVVVSIDEIAKKRRVRGRG
ncbi:MAG: helix-turn-helix transcriptional regulator [Rhodoferax sp.]|nr:helix-turn-helix transcriptional regulator [Rhodoferax sp.]